MAQSCKLPEQMVVQILLKLRPKSLIRFKCVCKTLQNLINSPSFVAKHLSISMHNNNDTVLFKRTIFKDTDTKDDKELKAIIHNPYSDKREILLSTLDIDNDNDDHFVVEDIRVPPPMSLCPLSLQIAGHCDGIICLKHFDNENIVLCNPSLKEFKLLPKSCLLIPPPTYPEDEEDDGCDYCSDEEMETSTKAVGFGYDSKGKIYKVVRAVSFIAGPVFCELPSRVEVYTLGADSWREIECHIDPHPSWNPSFQIYFKGLYYWIARASEEKRNIISFDMSDEVFHEMSIPESSPDAYEYTSLALWKESLVVLTYPVEAGVSRTLDLWVMDDQDFSRGAEGSWTKHLTIGPVEGVEIPLMFWKSDELLMVDADGRIVSYNLDTQKLKKLPLHGVEGADNIQAVGYVNTLVSVNKLEGS